LYYQHRVSPNIPVEEIAESMGKLISERFAAGGNRKQPPDKSAAPMPSLP
jgi:hypothetical protein